MTSLPVEPEGHRGGYRRPSFLGVQPQTGERPRHSRLTHVLDKGLAPRDLITMLERVDWVVDIWKFGWGTAYLEPNLMEKVALLKEHGIATCLGGTLLEAAWMLDQVDACLSWAADVGVSCVEVSNGVVGMPYDDKRRLIERASSRFSVVAEVGSKHPTAPVTPDGWVEEMCRDLDAGATWAITEGREHGNVGLFAEDGQVQQSEAEQVIALVGEKVGISRVIFEAPLKDQQAWFINRAGPQVNLGNIPPDEVFALESLRMGLRGDTLHLLTAARRESPSDASVTRR